MAPEIYVFQLPNGDWILKPATPGGAGAVGLSGDDLEGFWSSIGHAFSSIAHAATKVVGIALPAVGAILGGPMGAAAGNAMGALIKGGPGTDARVRQMMQQGLAVPGQLPPAEIMRRQREAAARLRTYLWIGGGIAGAGLGAYLLTRKKPARG